MKMRHNIDNVPYVEIPETTITIKNQEIVNSTSSTSSSSLPDGIQAGYYIRANSSAEAKWEAPIFGATFEEVFINQ